MEKGTKKIKTSWNTRQYRCNMKRHNIQHKWDKVSFLCCPTQDFRISEVGSRGIMPVMAALALNCRPANLLLPSKFSVSGFNQRNNGWLRTSSFSADKTKVCEVWGDGGAAAALQSSKGTLTKKAEDSVHEEQHQLYVNLNAPNVTSSLMHFG